MTRRERSRRRRRRIASAILTSLGFEVGHEVPPPAAVAAEITHRVEHDADYPGPQRLGGPVAGRGLEDLQEDVLEQVVAMAAFDSISEKETVDEAPVGQQQLIKGLLIAAAVPGQPVALIKINWLWLR